MSTTTDDFAGRDAVASEDPDDLLGSIPLPPPPQPAAQPLHAAWRPPLGPVRKTIREIGWNLITAGLLVLLFVAYQLWGTGFAEAASQARLKKQFGHPVAAAAPSSSGTSGSGDAATVGGAASGPALPGVPEGSAIDHMTIPKIGLDKYVVEGVADADLSEGPGHYPGTPLPGEPGNVAIAGHRTTYGAPFFDLNNLVAGDKIYITNESGQTFLYVVNHSEVVKPSDVAVVAPTSDNRLTLTTCNPRYEATTRLIVVAMLESLPVAPPPTVAPRVVTTKANLGGGQRSAWPPTIVFAIITIGLWVGVRLWARRRRYWKWIPFLVGIPVCSVPLWFMFENVIKLLPNNL